MDDTLVAGDPADSVVQEPEEIAVADEPVSTLNVSWKPGDATGACLADHDCGLVGIGGGWISEFRRILYRAGNDSQNWLLHWLKRKAILCAGKPISIGEACENRVLALDAPVICVAVCADNIPCLTDAEKLGHAEVGARIKVLVVETGLEAGHDRSAGVYVVTDLLALAAYREHRSS
jgi:hypothetical protein